MLKQLEKNIMKNWVNWIEMISVAELLDSVKDKTILSMISEVLRKVWVQRTMDYYYSDIDSNVIKTCLRQHAGHVGIFLDENSYKLLCR